MGSNDLSEKRHELRDVFGDREVVRVDSALAEQLSDAYDLLKAMSEIEELFALVSSCYADFETNLFAVALESHIHGNSASSEPIELSFGKKKDRIRQTVLSMLTAYRALCDQAPQRLGSVIAGNMTLASEFNRLKSQTFDSSMEFRLFDALRNIMTHKILPFGNIGITRKLLIEDWSNHETSSSVNISVQELPVPKEVWVDSKIRKKTRTEVDALPFDQIDMKATVRGFVSALFGMRNDFHKATKQNIQIASETFERAYTVFHDELGVEARFIELWGASDQAEERICPVKRTFADLVVEQRGYSSSLTGAGMSYPTVEITERQNTFQGSFDRLWKR